MPIAEQRRAKEEVGWGGGGGGGETTLGDVTERVTMTTLFGGHRDCFKVLRMLHLVFLPKKPKHA